MPVKPNVASMSLTTQRCQHSPIRRRKSMPFTAQRNIKVIGFCRLRSWSRHSARWPRLAVIGLQLANIQPMLVSSLSAGRLWSAAHRHSPQKRCMFRPAFQQRDQAIDNCMCNRRQRRHPNYFISMKRCCKPHRISLCLQRKITPTAKAQARFEPSSATLF
jgi:hypothetical protein